MLQEWQMRHDGPRQEYALSSGNVQSRSKSGY